VFYVAIVIFIGMAINAKSGVDRIIYGVLAAAIAALIHQGGITAASPWSF
jgi:hypothetical protein